MSCFCTDGKISVRINLPLLSTVLPSNCCYFCPLGLSFLIQHLTGFVGVVTEVTSTSTRPIEKCCINNERPTEQKQLLLDGKTVENKSKLIHKSNWPL